MVKTLKLIPIGFLALICFYVIRCEVRERNGRARAAELNAQLDAACAKNDFETAYNIISKMNRAVRRGKREKVRDKEINYLVSMNSDDASNRIVYLLTENFQFASKPYPAGTYRGSDIEKIKLSDYNSSVSSLNIYCDRIFSLAASQGNKYLCQKLLFFYQEDLKDETIDLQKGKRISDAETEEEAEETHSITYINTAKESAIKKYKDFFGEDPKFDGNSDI